MSSVVLVPSGRVLNCCVPPCSRRCVFVRPPPPTAACTRQSLMSCRCRTPPSWARWTTASTSQVSSGRRTRTLYAHPGIYGCPRAPHTVYTAQRSKRKQVAHSDARGCRSINNYYRCHLLLRPININVIKN